MNATLDVKPKRSHHKKKPETARPGVQTIATAEWGPLSGGVEVKPKLGHLDPLEAAQETARCAQEGNVKLSRAIDSARLVLQTIATAEWDRERSTPVTAADLRKMATAFLAEQGWLRRMVVESRAGDRDLNSLQE